jgi:hypothetical protein
MRARWNGPMGMREVRPYASRAFVYLWGRPQVRWANPPRLSTLGSQGGTPRRSTGVGHHGDGRVENTFDVSPVRYRQ